MAIDIDALLESPQFAAGISLLGTASPRNEGLLTAYQAMQGMRKSKEDRAYRQRQLELEESGSRRADAQAKLYERQVLTAEQNAAREARRFETLQQAVKAYQERRGVTLPGQALPQPTQQPQSAIDPVSGFFRNKILAAEGGIDPRTGAFRTSPKGAIGPAQVMPDTAPEAAQLAGLPFDDRRYRTDPEYNTTIGEAYFKKQLEDFGDLPSAAAAYNAGPARLKEAQKRATQFGNPSAWLSFMPKETQAYVQNTTGYTGGMVPSQLQRGALQPPPQPSIDPFAQQREDLEFAGTVRALSGDMGGLKDLAEAGKPHTVTPGQTIYGPGGATTVPDPLGERRVRADEARVGIAAQQAQAATTRAAAERDREERIRSEKDRELRVQHSKDKAAFDNVSKASERMSDSVDKLLSHPGLPKITGIRSLTNPIALPGGPAKDAIIELEGLKSKAVNDVLQSVRLASSSGASGYGQFTEKELKVIETYITNLNTARDPEEFKASLLQLKKFADDVKNRSATLYEESTGQSAVTGLPKGSRKIGTSNGKPVYQLPDGSRVRGK